MIENPDNVWETIGATDPYFGVLTHDKYRTDNLSDARREEFWQSGRDEIGAIFAKVRQHIDPDFAPKNALDFGCGVGRLLFAIASRVERATGIDVSASMLKEAGTVAKARGIDNIALRQSPDCQSLPAGAFDFINSIIVFQHIPADRGSTIFRRLLRGLRPSGVGVLHFTYSLPDYPLPDSPAPRPLSDPRSHDRGRAALHGLLHGNKPLPESTAESAPETPVIPMNEYDLNFLLGQLHLASVDHVYIDLTDHGRCGQKGATLYFKKPGIPASPLNDTAITALYRALLEREPDPEGLAHYRRQIEAGATCLDMYNSVLESGEWRALPDEQRRRRRREAEAALAAFERDAPLDE